MYGPHDQLNICLLRVTRSMEEPLEMVEVLLLSLGRRAAGRARLIRSSRESRVNVAYHAFPR
jgi:hypothetical protein